MAGLPHQPGGRYPRESHAPVSGLGTAQRMRMTANGQHHGMANQMRDAWNSQCSQSPKHASALLGMIALFQVVPMRVWRRPRHALDTISSCTRACGASRAGQCCPSRNKVGVCQPRTTVPHSDCGFRRASTLLTTRRKTHHRWRPRCQTSSTFVSQRPYKAWMPGN